MEKDFWLMFIKDPSTGVIHCTGYTHNAAGDYANNPYFIGYSRISINLDKLAIPTPEGDKHVL